MGTPPAPLPPTGEMGPEELAMMQAYLQLYGQQQEEAELSRETLRDILGGLGFPVPYTMEEIEEATIALMQVEALERAAQAFGMPPTMLDPLQEQLGLARATLLERATDVFGERGGAAAQAISEYVTTTIERQELVSRDEVMRRREYLDIPTPEEFLDEFNVALATHTEQLVETGELDRDTAQWIRDNPDILFDRYIAAMGERAATGEQIFKPVGVEGEPELLGERPGRREVRDVETVRGALTETARQAQQVAQVTAGGVTVPRTTQRTTQEVTRLTERERLGATFAETEEIYARPRLGYAYALSPTEWLKEYAAGTEITYGAEREKGRREEERRGITGIPQPRRVV